MTNSNKRIGILVVLLILAALIWYIAQRQVKPDTLLTPVASHAQNDTAGPQHNDGPIENEVPPEVTLSGGTTSDTATVEDPLEQLSELLPKWLREEGKHYQDSRVINGHTVHRSRGRFEWENGEQLEIEITDVGSAANEALLQSLGFDLGLTDNESETGFTITQSHDGYLINQEYDYNDLSGSLQMLIDDRFFIEIQVQQLSEESFQEILDRDIPFDKIFKRLENKE